MLPVVVSTWDAWRRAHPDMRVLDDVVVLGEPDPGAARAYQRGARTFRAGATPTELVETATGTRWRVEEERLVEPASGRTLPRVGAHLGYWFGWYAFYPDAEVYAPPP